MAGLTFTTTVEYWVLTAGASGSAIWQNGVKVASQATAIARTAGGGEVVNLNDNSTGASGDLQEINFVQMIDGQWSDDLCRWWSAEPYVHLSVPTIRRYAFIGGSSAVVVPPKKGGAGNKGGPGGKSAYGPTWVVPWDSVNAFGAY